MDGSDGDDSGNSAFGCDVDEQHKDIMLEQRHSFGARTRDATVLVKVHHCCTGLTSMSVVAKSLQSNNQQRQIQQLHIHTYRHKQTIQDVIEPNR